jgi:hypothetical protein
MQGHVIVTFINRKIQKALKPVASELFVDVQVRNRMRMVLLPLGPQPAFAVLELDWRRIDLRRYRILRRTLRRICHTNTILTKLGLHCQFCPQIAPKKSMFNQASIDITFVEN